MIYELVFEPQAKKDIAELKKNSITSYSKLIKLFVELIEHPETGAGRPEQMKYGFSGLWSRRIDRKNRLVYKINDNTVTITVVSVLGHYGDK